jgi:DNA-binding MarR family transcriptional regulator
MATSNRRGGSNAPFDLSAHLPHLLRRAHFEAEARFTEVYGAEATSRQLALLVSVAQSKGATQADIARQVGLDVNTCSDLVRRTCERGWLLRRRSTQDARAFSLELTPAGRRLVREYALPLAQPYVDRVADRLTEAERRRLTGLLRKLLGLHRPPEDAD